MAFLKIWQVSRAIMRLQVIQFFCWLGWFSTSALAQFDISEGVTGSLSNFPTLCITCVGNLAVFVTSLIRRRLDLEMGARDVLDVLLSPKFQNIKRIKHGYGLTTCTQRNAANEGGGDLPTASAEQVPQTASREESDVHAASTEQVPQTASTEESDVHAASTRGTETGSTEGNVNTSASTQRGGLQTASTAEIVLQIDSTEGEAGSENDEEEAAAIRRLPTRKQGLERAAVIMLSNDTANGSMKQFMKLTAYVVQSIVLPFLPLKRALNDTKVSEELTSGVTIKSCECRHPRCHCIVFWTMEEITHMLATRMPASLKLLSNSLCLLPCSTCVRKGCHECNQENLLRAESEADEGQPTRQTVVSGILNNIRAGDIPAGKSIGICIPMNDALGDAWTKLLLKCSRSKDGEGRGVTNMTTEALEGYLAGGRRSAKGSVEYDIFSFVVPRLTEVLINLVLTFWFRIDGFSSALLARRTVREYLLDTKSSGFAANAFLTKAVVKSNGDNSQVCQVLTFRGRDWLCFITFISVGCVNLICALGWALLITFEGGPDASQPPSLPGVAVIIAAIGSPWVVLAVTVMVAKLSTSDGIDSFLSFPVELFLKLFSDINVPRFVVRLVDFLLVTSWRFMRVFVAVLQFLEMHMNAPRFVVRLLDFLLMTGRWFVRVSLILVFMVISPVLWPGLLLAGQLIQRRNEPYASPLIATGLLFEMACFVSWSALAGALGIKGFGRWLYGALQILIWVKWATGSYLLNKENSLEFFGRNPHRWILLLYSSAFWLNAVLAGVRCKWEAWPWQRNHLFSFVSQ